MRVQSALDISTIDNFLTLYGACVVQNVLNANDVRTAQQQLIADHHTLSQIEGYTIATPEDGRFGRFVPRLYPGLEEQIAPLQQTLAQLYEKQVDNEYVELVYMPTDTCAQPGLVLHEDIDLTYNLALQAFDETGAPDDRLYIKRHGIHQIQLALDEVLVISGTNGLYEPVLHGVRKDRKKRFAQFILCT